MYQSFRVKLKIIHKLLICVFAQVFLSLLVLFFKEKLFGGGMTVFFWLGIAGSFLPTILMVSLINQELLQPLAAITKMSGRLTDSVDDHLNIRAGVELAPLVENLKKADERIAAATQFAKNIGDGNFEITDIATDSDFGLGKALGEMREKLMQVAEEERKRNWTIAGVAKFGQLFRDYQNADLKEFAYQMILNLAKYLNANQGAVFSVNDNDPSDLYIELIGCYAYERKKHVDFRLDMGEGLVGQCIADKDTIYITDIPEDYIRITSGIGEATPTSILIVPLKLNDSVFGAIEIASFDEFQPYQIAFVEEVAESFSSTLSAVKTNDNTNRLLRESQQITEILRVKENELVKNEEDLRAAQETLNNKLIELQAETNLTKCILDAINKSNAAIEFDMDGNVLNANEMFLSVMGYDKMELIGKGERLMVPEDEITSKRYEMLWDSLKKGNFNTGEFRRFSKNGREIWIDATYNPILDLNGYPYKILMFANFTTEAKEKENEYRNRINALNETFGLMEINPDLSLKTTNQILLEQLKLKRKDVKTLNFKSLLFNGGNDEKIVHQTLATMERGEIVKNRFVIKKADDTVADYYVAISPSNSITGKLVSYIALFVPTNNFM